MPSSSSFADQTFDVLIIGGGVNGAGVARDLALRAKSRGHALRVALVEKNHFSSGTSGRNSQLIHGGLRYLKYFDFGLVREALHERAVLLRIAPHLVEPLQFLIPMYSQVGRFYYGTGLWLYDLLAGTAKISRHESLPADEVARIEPGLNRQQLVSASLFYDCRVHSARLVLENVVEAVENGVVAANYTSVVDLKPGPPWTVTLEDSITGVRTTCRARKVVDATGAWSRQEGLRLVRGSHLIVPRLTRSEYAISYFERNGRIIFVIPWGSRGDLSLVGTTDIDHHTGPDDVRVSGEEVEYLMRIIHEVFPDAGDVPLISAYSSLRPLVREESANATSTSRAHKIWDTGDGMVRIAGGKYTTYRQMSEEAADLAVKDIAPELASVHLTADTPLLGNSVDRLRALRSRTAQLAAQYGLTGAEAAYAVRDYGVRAEQLLALLPADETSISRLERAQIAFAARHEMVQRLPDFLFVSTYLGYERRWTRLTLARLADELGRHLNWNERRRDEEVDLAIWMMEQPALSARTA